MDEPEGFRKFVATSSPTLLRSAWLLTGHERTAEDLVQATFERMWPRWHRLNDPRSADTYARTTMLSIFLNWRRRRWRGELPVDRLPEQVDAHDALAEADIRNTVQLALMALPRRQRAVIVLRYFDDFTESQTAAALGCSVGTVKSQAARALAKLRVSLRAELTEDSEVTHDSD